MSGVQSNETEKEIEVAAVKRSFHQAEVTSIHKESVINRQSIKAMLEVRQLNRRKIFPIQAPPLPKKLNEKSGFKDNMQSCTPAYNYTITERLLHNRIIGDEAFSPLWAKLVSYGWKSVKGKGLSSWLYARPGACLDSKSRDGDTENILSSSTEVMTFVSLNKIDGINRFGDINEDYSNLIEDMLKDKNIQNMENEIAARQVTEVKVAAPAQAYFARGLPLHKFGTKSSQGGEGVNVKLTRKGSMAMSNLTIYPKAISMGTTEWVEDSEQGQKRGDHAAAVGKCKPLMSLPVSAAFVSLKMNFRVKDEKALGFTPYFGDHDVTQENVFGDLFDLPARQRKLDDGPPAVAAFHHERYLLFRRILLQHAVESAGMARTNGDALNTQDRDVWLDSMNHTLEEFRQKSTKPTTEAVPFTLKECREAIRSQVEGDQVESEEKQKRKKTKNSPRRKESPNKVTSSLKTNKTDVLATSSALSLSNKSVSSKPNEPMLYDEKYKFDVGVSEAEKSYLMEVDSYRHLSCRFCFKYDCSLHEDFGNHAAPAPLKLQTEHALESAPSLLSLKPSLGAGLNMQITSDRPTCSTDDLSLFHTAPWLPKDINSRLEGLFQRMYIIFSGNITEIAAAMKITVEKANELHKSVLDDLPSLNQDMATLSPKKRKACGTINNAKANFVSMKTNVTVTGCAPYVPCKHSGACDVATCHCGKEFHWCTKFCICAPTNIQSNELRKQSAKHMVSCANFFPGCRCKQGHCGTKACPCFTAGRECDPDLCNDCGACTKEGNCRNDNMSQGKRARLLVARSGLPNAGWGLFVLNDLPKGSFVHEYIGEVITQEEAERRGRLYDKLNRSYLFNLNADYCVDAARKGNKMRFANHSSKPNVEPRVMYVNGSHRIGMFAKEDIKAQQELFFDYGYDKEITSASLHKQAVQADWMQDSALANTISTHVGLTLISTSAKINPNGLSGASGSRGPRLTKNQYKTGIKKGQQKANGCYKRSRK